MTMKRTYVKKDGTITIHEYDNKEYCKIYNEVHKEYYAEKLTCECGLQYARNNKYYHKKTKAHLMYESLKDKLIKD